MVIVVLVTTALLTSTAHAQLGTTPAALALELALENNVRVRAFEQRCSAFGSVQRTLIGIIPINHQVLTAAVTYRAELHALDGRATQDLLDRSLARYLDGDEAVFLLFLLNPSRIDPNALVFLPGEGIRLQDEYRRDEPLRHTPVFDPNRSLGPGLTYGYVYYPNFRHAASESYAVLFDDGYVYLCAAGNGLFVHFALAFDEAELDFFDFLQRGISLDALRRNHGIPTYGDRGLTNPEFLDILNLVINLIGLIR